MSKRKPVDPSEFEYDELSKATADPMSADPLQRTPEEIIADIMEMKKERLLSVRQAALYTGLSMETIYAFAQQGRHLDTSKNEKGQWQITEESLDRYMGGLKDTDPHKRMNRIAKEMTDESTGLVTIVQAAAYVGKLPEVVRKVYNDGHIKGTKVSSYIMLDADSVREYKKNLISGRYNPRGYLYHVSLEKHEITQELLMSIVEAATETSKISVYLQPQGLEVLREAGFDPVRAFRQSVDRKKSKSKLELTDEYKELLQQARQGKGK